MLSRRRFLANLTGIASLLAVTCSRSADTRGTDYNRGEFARVVTRPDKADLLGKDIAAGDAQKTVSPQVDEVLQRVNILDVVSPYVDMQQDGKNFVGICPFHNESTPSFTVSVEKQIYYRFDCHEGGNAVHFLAKHDRLSFEHALERLANQIGIKVHGGRIPG